MNTKLKENGKYILTLRCKDAKFPLAGSEKRPCALCGELSLVSPILQKQKVDGVICLQCAKGLDPDNLNIDMKLQLKVLESLKERKEMIAG